MLTSCLPISNVMVVIDAEFLPPNNERTSCAERQGENNMLILRYSAVQYERLSVLSAIVS